MCLTHSRKHWNSILWYIKDHSFIRAFFNLILHNVTRRQNPYKIWLINVVTYFALVKPYQSHVIDTVPQKYPSTQLESGRWSTPPAEHPLSVLVIRSAENCYPFSVSSCLYFNTKIQVLKNGFEYVFGMKTCLNILRVMCLTIFRISGGFFLTWKQYGRHSIPVQGSVVNKCWTETLSASGVCGNTCKESFFNHIFRLWPCDSLPSWLVLFLFDYALSSRWSKMLNCTTGMGDGASQTGAGAAVVARSCGKFWRSCTSCSSNCGWFWGTCSATVVVGIVWGVVVEGVVVVLGVVEVEVVAVVVVVVGALVEGAVFSASKRIWLGGVVDGNE